MDLFAQRRDKLRKLLRTAGIHDLLVTSVANVTYLTGFTGDDSYLLVCGAKEILLSDSRFTVQLSEECPSLPVEIRSTPTTMLQLAAQLLRQAKIKKLGIEAASMSVALRTTLGHELPAIEFAPTGGLVEELRMVKDKPELDAIRRAIHFAERGFAMLRASLRPDQTERQIAAELEHNLRLDGAKGCAFQPIIAVGSRAALPHAPPTLRQVREGDHLLVDWGADEGLYKSDVTRTLVTGKPTTKLQKVYEIVLHAQLAAIEKIRPGATCEEVDATARKVIADAGFGKFFGHGLGHGFGLQIHESPRFAANQPQQLLPGMVVTVEPGIYLPGWGGVRIEDDILVTKAGAEVLTHTPKQWDEALVE